MAPFITANLANITCGGTPQKTSPDNVEIVAVQHRDWAVGASATCALHGQFLVVMAEGGAAAAAAVAGSGSMHHCEVSIFYG